MEKYFVLDFSVSMSWCFADEMDDYSMMVLQSLNQHKALVPSLWNIETANVLLCAERQQRLSISSSTQFMDKLGKLPIYVSDLVFSSSEILATGREYDLSSYDSIYFLLALHSAKPLATKDQKLISACAKSGVRVF